MEVIVIGAGILVLFLAVVGIRDDAYGRNARRAGLIVRGQAASPIDAEQVSLIAESTIWHVTAQDFRTGDVVYLEPHYC